LLRKLDELFLSDDPDEITTIDRIFFYGVYILLFIVASFTVLSLVR